LNPAEYARLDAEESSGWWFVAKREFLRSAIRRLGLTGSAPSLDIGCGTGAILGMLEQTLHPALPEGSPAWLHGLDISPEALHFARHKTRATLTAGGGEHLPYRSEIFQLVVMADVLEHIDNDRYSLAEVYRVLQRGGTLLLSAPAHPLLWCDHDVALEHRRRYRRSDLQRKLFEAGFQVQTLDYRYCLVFPGAVAVRLCRKARPPKVPRADLGVVPGPVNRILIGLMLVEDAIASRVLIPFGSSLFAIARRPENQQPLSRNTG
jgi:SAM-dependent methyltransferase